MADLESGEGVDERLALAEKELWPTLNLGHQGLKVVPPQLERLIFLKSLLLNNNSLIMPPDEITHLHQLLCLSLENNQLTILPSRISQLTSLQFLNLSHNKLSCLPPAISQLVNLRELWLAHVGLSDFPAEIYSLQRLELLSLEGNSISSIEEFGHLQSLSWLSLAGNRLRQVGGCFQTLRRLKVLVLEANCLTAFPEVLLHLPELVNINLRGNRISSLQPSIGEVILSSAGERFAKLDLRDNALQEKLQAKPVWASLLFVKTDN